MCIRKGYILALGYERGAIWVKKKTGTLNWGKGLSLGAEPPCIKLLLLIAWILVPVTSFIQTF